MLQATLKMLTLLLMAFLCTVLPTAHAGERTWGCYDPQPPHPTAQEAGTFVARLLPTAQELQGQYGVPRAGILAMVVQESGYGWTRTAQFARNLFGWKYGKSAKAAGLSSWRLECQPPSDPDKGYAAFASFEDSMRFVAGQLTQGRYASATASARAAMSQGMSEKAVTLAWLQGVQQAGFNPNANYPMDVVRAGEAAGVFAAASAVAMAPPTPISSASQHERDAAQVLRWLKRDDRGRYMVTGASCAPEAQAHWPGYQALPDNALQRCRYTVTSCENLTGAKRTTCEAHRKVLGAKSATVVLLEPGLDRFAEWVASACEETGGVRQTCLKRLYDDGVTAGNWQIPIAGIVFEDMEPSFVQYGYAFRDGMTVASDTACAWQNGSHGENAPSSDQDTQCSRPVAEPAGVSYMVRPMSTTLSELRAWHPDTAASVPPHAETFPVKGAAAAAWRTYVQKVIVQSYDAASNPLVTARAVALHKQRAF